MSDCSCVYVEYEGSDCGFYFEETRTARKAHKCGECGAEIKPGDKYEHVVGKWGGGIEAHKTCDVCVEIRDKFFCGGYAFGMVWEDLDEHLRYAGAVPECIASLSPAARATVCDAIEEIWADQDEDGEVIGGAR